MNDPIDRTRQTSVPVDDEAGHLEVLNGRLTELKQRISRRFLIRRVALGLAALSAVWGAIASLRGEGSYREYALVFGAAYAAFFLIGAGASSSRRLEVDAKDLEDEIDLRQMRSASLEQKAHKLLKIQQGQLTRYLEVILQQSRSIFLIGIMAMLVGVGVVVFTIWETRSMGADIDPIQKAIVAIVGAIGAILTNYVAVIYLKMFSDIGAAVQRSVGSLSQSTNLNFANVLVANITTEEGRNDSLKQIALGISKLSPDG